MAIQQSIHGLRELALFAGAGVTMNKKYCYGIEKKCAECGSLFRSRDKDTDKKKSIFCSYACRGKSQTKTKMCAVCEKEFKPSRPQYETCGRECGMALRLSRKTIDPLVAVRRRLALFTCGLISRCLRSKTDTTKKLLGYTNEQLRRHLEEHFEPGMSWDNYGKKADSWSIDHTKPITKWPESATLKQINALTNLRPMWHVKNCAKGNRSQ